MFLEKLDGALPRKFGFFRIVAAGGVVVEAVVVVIPAPLYGRIMTARDIFGVILRVCGLVLVYRGFGVLRFQIAVVFAPGPGRMLIIPFLHGAMMLRWESI